MSDMCKKLLLCFLIGVALFFSIHFLAYNFIVDGKNGHMWLMVIFLGINPSYFAFSGFMLGDNFIKCSLFPVLMSGIFIWSVNIFYHTYDGYIYSIVYILVYYIFMLIRKKAQKRILIRRANKRKIFAEEDENYTS